MTLNSPTRSTESATGGATEGSTPNAPRKPWPTTGLSYGGDYNPEQWSRDVWQEDVRLMTEAGVNLVSLGIFSWGLVETAEGVYDWSWLDEIVALLHENHISIDLATPTAAPPQWLLAAHPEILPVDSDMHQHWPGARLGWCPSSPIFRRYALSIDAALAERYGHHPAVTMWHVSNELGGGNGQCFCDVSVAAFQAWVEKKYRTLDTLNDAWGTAFWGHHLTAFSQVLPPRGRDAKNGSLELDFARFSSDALLDHYLAERGLLESITPDLPITTNFMVGANPDAVDYPRWAEHMDILANDHYTISTDLERDQDVAFSDDRMRAMTANRDPWLLMEHSTSAVSWQPRNRAKEPLELIRNSLTHVARGSDGAMFFQWRASKAGAEQFHSAMVPHTGTNTKVWREVVALGHALTALGEVQGSRVEPARVAIIFDDEAAWAFQHGVKPNNALSYATEPRKWHNALWQRNILVDVVSPWADLTGYSLVIAPGLFLVSDENAANITSVVENGAILVVTYLSGIVDSNNHVRLGGYPGAFREVLGMWTEEFFPLLATETLTLDSGWRGADWSEAVHADHADVVARYASGPLTGGPAVTRRASSSGTTSASGTGATSGTGAAWYVSASLDATAIHDLTATLIRDAHLSPAADTPAGVEAVRRVSDDASYLFLINHTGEAQNVVTSGRELITGSTADGSVALPAGGVRVIRESHTGKSGKEA
jgi:beta-galactosidase